MAYRLVLWGVGNKYNALLNRIHDFEKEDQIRIVGVTANDGMPRARELDGYRIFPKNELNEQDFDYVVVLNERHFGEIRKEIETLLGTPEKVLSYRVFEIPNLRSFGDYVDLKEERLTILSNNCWGGTVYNTLGLECMSPIKNLFLQDEDYLQLLGDPKSYFAKALEFKRYDVDINSNKEYPVMQLGDIEVHCNHASNSEEVRELWERRCKKINYENMFVEMYTKDKQIETRFNRLEYEKKICFVPYVTEQPNSLTIDLYEGQTKFWQGVNINGSKAGLKYELIPLLLRNEIKLRY